MMRIPVFPLPYIASEPHNIVEVYTIDVPARWTRNHPQIYIIIADNNRIAYELDIPSAVAVAKRVGSCDIYEGIWMGDHIEIDTRNPLPADEVFEYLI